MVTNHFNNFKIKLKSHKSKKMQSKQMNQSRVSLVRIAGLFNPQMVFKVKLGRAFLPNLGRMHLIRVIMEMLNKLL